MANRGSNLQIVNSQGGSDTLKISPYDITICNQDDFVALYSSSNWLGATSVCFVGDGGTLTFTRNDGIGLLIPATVKTIIGINNPIINITNFAYSTTNKGILWYNSLNSSPSYSIENITVQCSDSSTDYAFYNCANLTNCNAIQLLFYSCYGLTNCQGAGFYDSPVLINCNATYQGILNCDNLINCKSITSSAVNSYGFDNCNNLLNCIGIGSGQGASGSSGIGFNACENLVNCTGTGTGSVGYGFYNCSYCNGCRKSTTPNSTALWGGTTTKRDDSSCDLS